MNQPLLRSVFFVPGHVDKYLEKAESLKVDAIIFDLEDSVPFDRKEDARKKVAAFLKNKKTYAKTKIVRINILEEGEVLKDLMAVVCDELDCIMPSKVNSVDDIKLIDGILFQIEKMKKIEHGSTRLLPLIETLQAFINVDSIAISSQRLIALAFGGEDYLFELGGSHGNDNHTFSYPRTRIAIAAKAAGLQAIDTPYLDVKNHEGFMKREQKSRDLGFEGCLVIHPSQIEFAHHCFSPSDKEIAEANKIMSAIEQSKKKGLNVILSEGVLVGPPMLKKAMRVIERLNEINRAYD